MRSPVSVIVSLDLTMNVCTDPQLLDVAGALEKLPELGVGVTSGAEQNAAEMAGGREGFTGVRQCLRLITLGA